MVTIDQMWLAERARELKAGILFLTRLRYGASEPVDGAMIGRAAWAFPVAGLLVGVVGAVVYGLAYHVGLPGWPAAALAVAATMTLTGCLHEDGLADTIDGFGGGKTREEKLAIMRDRRTGVFGACVLAVAILLKAGVLASLGHGAAVAAALIAANAGARAAMPFFLFLPAARADGLAFDAGAPPRESTIAAGVIGLAAAVVALGPVPALMAAVLVFVAVALFARLTIWQIGGQTGDVIGAVEQVCEIAILVVASRAAV